ncbi:MAG: SprB repeat-containing protein [Saprospiraceae bacterium]
MKSVLFSLLFLLNYFVLFSQQSDNFQYSVQSTPCVYNSGALTITATTEGLTSFPLPWYIEVESMHTNEFRDFDMESNSIIIEDLEAGHYSVIVWLDYESGCFQTFEIVVEIDDHIDITATIKTNSNCVAKNYANGEITVSTLNGTPPYSFIWSDNKTGQNRVGLKVGYYTVTITDQLKWGLHLNFTNAQGDPVRHTYGQINVATLYYANTISFISK